MHCARTTTRYCCITPDLKFHWSEPKILEPVTLEPVTLELKTLATSRPVYLDRWF